MPCLVILTLHGNLLRLCAQVEVIGVFAGELTRGDDSLVLSTTNIPVTVASLQGARLAASGVMLSGVAGVASDQVCAWRRSIACSLRPSSSPLDTAAIYGDMTAACMRHEH